MIGRAYKLLRWLVSPIEKFWWRKVEEARNEIASEGDIQQMRERAGIVEVQIRVNRRATNGHSFGAR
jgi:hypothetical protein